jgi:nitrate reductase delta subunit
MIKTFKVFSALLSYPTRELQQSAGALREAVDAENLLPPSIRTPLVRLIEDVATADLYDLQERYVLLFDRTRSLSLHLFEHVHGESRDRGQAMIDLKALYDKNGLTMSQAELPDFLPVFLEFLSTRPGVEAREHLGQTAHILTALAERLRKRRSPYEAVFRALIALASVKPKEDDVAAVLAEPDHDPADLAALDAAWQDEEVKFGPGASRCKDDLVARIRAWKRPAAAGPQA